MSSKFVKRELKVFFSLYQRLNLKVIPLAVGSKVPVEGLKLAQVYEGQDFHYNWETHYGNIGIVTGFENFCVIDCDTKEAIEWFESLEEYIPTVVVKTRRGHHYWYCIYDAKPEQRKSFTIQDAEGVFKVDILFGNKYVVAPPSEIRNKGEYHKYVFIDGYDPVRNRLQISLMDYETLKAIIEKAYRKAGRTISSEKIYKKIEEVKVSEEEERENIEKFLKVVEICKNFYYEGNRQNIWLGLAGIARKLGISKEITKEILMKELYYGMNDDDNEKQRLTAIDGTYDKRLDEIAGISILAERVVDAETLEEIARILRPLKYKVVDREEIPALTEEALSEAKKIVKIWNKTFALINNYWYVMSSVNSKKRGAKEEAKTGKILKPVCVGFLIKERGFDHKNQRPIFIAYNLETKREGEIDLDTINLKNFLGKPILDYKNLDYLWNALIGEKREKKFYSEMGWLELTENKKIFIHPLNNSYLLKHNVFCYLEKDLSQLFWYSDAEKQHEMVRNLLIEGKVLAAKIVFGACSLFLSPRVSGFSVFDVGPRGVGKTTTSQFVISLFYDANSSLTLEATVTGMELYLRRFKNLPVLFDETTFAKDKTLQEIVFLIASGVGKLRGTKKLSVDVGKLYSVIFITGEKDPEFERRGAERRVIIIPVSKWSDYTEMYVRPDLVRTFTKMQGVGFDWIKWLEENQDFQDRMELPQDLVVFNFCEVIEKTLAFLKTFYNLSDAEFERTYKIVVDILYEQFERIDIHFTKLINHLSEFILKYAPNFIITGLTANREPTSGQIFGCIDADKNKIFVRTEVLRKFCEEAKVDFRTVINKLEEKGILLANVEYMKGGFFKKRDAKVKRIKYQGQSFVVSGYELDLDKISEEFRDQLISEAMKSEGKSFKEIINELPF